jgi:hypothetical protein
MVTITTDSGSDDQLSDGIKWLPRGCAVPGIVHQSDSTQKLESGSSRDVSLEIIFFSTPTRRLLQLGQLFEIVWTNSPPPTNGQVPHGFSYPRSRHGRPRPPHPFRRPAVRPRCEQQAQAVHS